jgi:hypothetical protein
VDGCRALVAGAGRLASLLDRVAVVPGAFNFPGAGAVPPPGVEFSGDRGQGLGQALGPVVRGKNPPSRWRYGG